MMKLNKILILCLAGASCFSIGAFAQDAQSAAAAAAAALTEAKEEAPKEGKPSNWTKTLMTNFNFNQTMLENWAKGGDNTYALKGYLDGNANWKKGEMFWNNRLQLDYGFVYASSKPILQKSDDRIYLESKYGYKMTEKLYISANYDFKSQFADGWTYATPGNIPEDADRNQLIELWKNARVPKSAILSPATTTLGIGIDWKPKSWLSVNFAPLTGGLTIVNDPRFRKSYSMDVRKAYKNLDKEGTEYKDLMASGTLYRPVRFELGTQLKADAKFIINDNFSYTTQLVLFSNYLDHPENVRVNWDNRIDVKLAKYFSLTITTNLIYDDKVLIFSEADGLTTQRVQFKESLGFGFTYTFATKKK